MPKFEFRNYPIGEDLDLGEAADVLVATIGASRSWHLESDENGNAIRVYDYFSGQHGSFTEPCKEGCHADAEFAQPRD